LATGSQCTNVPDIRAFPPEQPSLEKGEGRAC
jgi:hypothetical protein